MRSINGKSLREISDITGIAYPTIKWRYDSGDRTWERITRDLEKSHTYEWRMDEMTEKGRRLLMAMNDRGMKLKTVSDKTGINRQTISKFMYYDTDISSDRLMRICATVGVSMDYVMGLRRER